MNIYEKIQILKQKLAESNLKKSGKNKFAGYDYFELADFLPTVIMLMNELKLCSLMSFSSEIATLTVVNSENIEEKVVITSPMEELELKGCNKVQALGGCETYQRRYLYMSLLDITENDMFDATVSGAVGTSYKANRPVSTLKEAPQETKVCCAKCGASVSDKVAKYSLDKFKAVYCMNCQKVQTSV